MPVAIVSTLVLMSVTKVTIESLLQKNGARFKGASGDVRKAHDRAHVTRVIAQYYPAFEPVRDHILNGRSDRPVQENRDSQLVLETLHKSGVVSRTEGRYKASAPDIRRYLSGGWLEELAYLAAMEARADEAVFSQRLHWQAKGYHGENEIDLILRKNERLGFVSCKAMASMLDSDNRKHRNRLMDALHEADNLADHFGRAGDKVAVLVTTDLIDEMRDQPRYMALMGKAAVLDVRLIPLEELGWNKLVAAIRELIEQD